MKLILNGSTGRMGSAILTYILENAQNITVVGSYSLSRSLPDSLPKADVAIDFSSPTGAMQLLPLAVKAKIPLVIGTTGISAAHDDAIHHASKQIPILKSGNFSLGVNLLLSLIKQAAEKLGESYDIEISEMHHRNKIDAPSGTAIMLGRAAAEGRKLEFENVKTLTHDGKRGTGIGFSSQRGGSVIGEHEVIFAGGGERVIFKHIADDRALFVQGALKAAEWLSSKPAGFYTMQDVLGLK